jgi:hypothetical protein
MWRGVFAVPAFLGTALVAQEFSGSVFEEHSAAPVRGARVQLRMRGVRQMIADLETGSDGTFRAPVNLPAGEYQVEISKPNYSGATLQLRIPLSGELAVRLARFGSITGRIIDSQNRPIPGATVLPMTAAADGHFRRLSIGTSAHVDNTGHYRLYNLPPGRYAVAVSWATINSTSASGSCFFPNNQSPEIFEIASGETIRGVDFVLSAQSEFTVSGRVRLARPDERSAVTLILREHPSLPAAIVLTEADGSFQFKGIAPGGYHLMAAAPAAAYAGFGALLGPDPVFGRNALNVYGDLEGIDVSLEPARVIRFSLKSSAGCPDSASVLLRPLENWGALLEKKFDLTGKGVVIQGLAPGRYRIAVSQPGSVCFGEQDRLIDFRTAEAVTINTVPGGMVEGRVESVDGKPPIVALTALDEPGTLAQLIVPDGDGRFVFAQLRPGRYRLSAETASRDIAVHSNAAIRVALAPLEKDP